MTGHIKASSRVRVSVVVATHERPERLEHLLRALRNQSLDRSLWEVIVVDDASLDAGTVRTLAAAEAESKLPLTVIRHGTRGGPATARQAGWLAATGDVIAFTDDDCEPAPDWLAAGLRALEQTRAGFVQGKTVPNPRELDALGPYSRTIEVTEMDPHFHTCNIFYRRDLLERIGGFDEDSFGTDPGGEDSDLAWRAIAAGADAAFDPGAVVFHAVSNLGPFGKLRVAARWTTPMKAFAMHSDLRRATFVYRVFWKHEHLWLLLLLLGVLLPRRLQALRAPLMLPALRSAYGRALTAGGSPRHAAYFLAHDAVETWAVARAALRYRRVML